MWAMDMFSMIGNYEQRKVDRYESADVTIDTCSVSDAPHPFETGILHPEYKDGGWLIVEYYDSKETAQIGHDKWVARMTAAELPPFLDDIAADSWNEHWGNNGREYRKTIAPNVSADATSDTSPRRAE